MASQSAAVSALASLIQQLMSISAVFPSSGSEFEPNNRILIINPVTQSFVLIRSNGDGDGDGFDFKDGEPPASKASIEGMQKVEVKSKEEIESIGGECVICMEEFVIGDVAKEMPCKHKFHGGCIEKWLKIHGTCPVCRYKMPVEDDVDKRVVRAEVWVTAGIGRLTTDHEDDDSENDL